MAFNLSSLLNPAPADGSTTHDAHDQRDTSRPPSHVLVPGSPSGGHATHTPESRPSGDAASGLVSFSASQASPPTSYNGTQYDAFNTSPQARRQSIYSDVKSPVELPQPPRHARKLSSPSLEQYHVSSKSPDRQRRSSFIARHESVFTLAPLQEQPTSQHNLPSTHSGEQALMEEDQTSRVEALAPREALPGVQSEAAASRRQSIPAFTPVTVASLKHEHSTHTGSPLREASLSVQSTEDMATPTSINKKRPAPKSTGKKGTANVKKGPPVKKRKLEHDSTPSSQKSKPLLKQATSTSATPLGSSPAPRSVRTASSPPRSSASAEPEAAYSDDGEQEEEGEDDGPVDPDADLYCICRRPDTGTFMIGCDGGCDDWFHGKCVGIDEKNKGLIDRYICPLCAKKGLGPTTWKRMCRRAGCRMPAKVGGKKGSAGTSKYCSDECGVLFFRDMVAQTRGADGAAKRSQRRKGGADVEQDDLGPRGGVLSARELKALVNAAPNIDDFKRLGEGVLSPPATPSPTATRTAHQTAAPDDILNDAESTRMAEIASQKDTLRTRHALLKDKTKFITMLKQAAIRLADERDMKPKEMCGYDPRITWTEARFAAWRASRHGSEAMKTGSLEQAGAIAMTTDADGDTGMRDDDDDDGGHDDDDDIVRNDDDDDELDHDVCTRRKCARHFDWAKLALDDVRFETGENSELMRALEKEEREVRERAGLRARELQAGGAAGSVEMHVAPDAMHVDAPGPAPDDEIVAVQDGAKIGMPALPAVPAVEAMMEPVEEVEKADVVEAAATATA